MKDKNFEKTIYEYLGVNIFRKYVLFSWEKICAWLGFDPGYRINGRTVKDFKKYKSLSKGFAVTHIFVLILAMVLGFVNSANIGFFIVNGVINLYCIMTQRYTHIRINELIEKLEKREAKLVELDHNMNIQKSLSQIKNTENKLEQIITNRTQAINASFNLNENTYSTYTTESDSCVDLDKKQTLCLVRDLLKKSSEILTIDEEINKDSLKSHDDVGKGYTFKI